MERLLRRPARIPRRTKDGALLGGACRSDKDREIRDALFPRDPAMPSGCDIKGKYALRARVTGNIGIYHLQACSELSGVDASGSLVLLRRRRKGSRIPQGLQLPAVHAPAKLVVRF